MTGKSSWVPSRTQGLFSHCCRWHCVSWLLQELLLSRCGWGVSLGQASLVIPIFAFVDRDLAWHCIKLRWKLIFKLICFRFNYQTRFVITFYSYSDDESICELYVICGMYVESCTILVVVNRFIETRRGTRRTTGFIWVQVWQCDRLRIAIVLVFL